MKLLWVSNSPIGPAADVLGQEYKGSSGGWIQSEYEQLDKKGIEFYFLCALPTVKENEILKRNNEIGTVYCIHTPKIAYGIRPGTKKQGLVQRILDEIQPDIIQIWGTETWLSNAVANARSEAKKIIFLQGLIGVHQRYLGGYIKNNIWNKHFAIRGNLVGKAKATVRSVLFRKQAEIERETLCLCNNVIIDNEFTQSYCEALSDGIRHFHHVLYPNKVFYEHSWTYGQCEKNTVFTVYGSNSEKGTHNLLRAVSIVKQSIPDIKVYIPGGYALDGSGKLTNSRNDPYQGLLYSMIKELELEDAIVFTGRMSASQMAMMMKRCNVFVNPSCMEVHALSLREAMTVGMPCISSLCGSVAEYLRHGENGLLYRYEEYENLAYLLKKILSDSLLAQKMGEAAAKVFRSADISSISFSGLYKMLLKSDGKASHRQ